MAPSQSVNRPAATLAPATTSRRSLRPRNPALNYKIDKPPKLKNHRTQTFAAKRILTQKTTNGQTEYLVDWHGRHPQTHRKWSPTWEPERNLNEQLLRSWVLHDMPERRPAQDNEGGSDDPNHPARSETDDEPGSPNEWNWDFMNDLEPLTHITEAAQNHDDRDSDDSDQDERSEDNGGANAIPPPAPPSAKPLSRGDMCVVCFETNLELYNVLDCCRQLVCPHDEMEWRSRQSDNVNDPVLTCPHCRTPVGR